MPCAHAPRLEIRFIVKNAKKNNFKIIPSRSQTKIDHTFQTNLRNVCLSVILEFCLLSVVCRHLSSSVCTLAPVLDQNRPYVSDKSKKCLSISNSGILSVVGRLSSSVVICRRLSVSSLLLKPAYVEIWNIYLKYGILFQLFTLRDGFLIFKTYFLKMAGNTTLYLKKKIKNERHLRLASHISTKHSQIVYLINTHILRC